MREIAGLRVGLVKERFPDLLGCDFDDCGSPFYLVPELEALGIIFLNPRGSFVSRAPVSITELLSDVKLDDGSSWYIFRRFMSKRHEELGLGEHFNFGKSISHPEALEFVLSDLLNRFANAREPGTGAIIYTHLGHKLGEQLSPGLGWPKLMHNWIDEVRRAFRFDGRIWFASASEILRFALVRKALLSAENCRISNGEIVIKSWVDPIRNIKLPGEETSWLSGQTIYVNKADGINVSLDGQPYTKGWKNNPADDSGNESVTLN